MNNISLVTQSYNLINFIRAAKECGLNYVFIDKNTFDNKIIEELIKEIGYSIVVGQGEVARIKISW
jgi:hypothetical protein